MNTKPKSEQTSGHWLAFYLVSPFQLEYFDSYGHHLSSYPLILNYFASLFTNLNYTFSNNKLQSLTSSVCGDYCITFLHLRIRNYSFSQIINLFIKFPSIHSLDSFVHCYSLLIQ